MILSNQLILYCQVVWDSRPLCISLETKQDVHWWFLCILQAQQEMQAQEEVQSKVNNCVTCVVSSVWTVRVLGEEPVLTAETVGLVA